jgi:hypothetical protein
MFMQALLHKSLILGAIALCLALGGCVDTVSDFNSAATPRAKAPGTQVALLSLEGAPEAVISRLSSAIAQQASRRDIVIVGVDGKPVYQLRGYVSAYAGTEQGELSWTFDMFDAKRKRAQRFSGQEELRTRGGADAWAAVSDQDVQKIAFKALDEVAAFLADAGAPQTGAPIARAPGVSSAGQRADTKAASAKAAGVLAAGLLGAQ